MEKWNEDGLVFSGAYADTMRKDVSPFLRAHVRRLTVSGAGGKPIAAFRFDASSPRGTVTLVHGFTECAEKYSELIFSLLRGGFSVLAYDQRGHGASWRDERITDISLTHVGRFQEYVDDLDMGLPLGVAKAICRTAQALGRGRSRILFGKPWAGPEDFETSCATGPERFRWYDALRVATERYHNNGPTYTWTLESLRVTDRLLAPGKPEGIQIPVLVYTAEDDGSVLPEAQEKLVRRLPHGQRKLVPGSRHEIYRSPDAVLFPWWHEILAFFG